MKIAVLVDTWFPHIGGGQINALEISNRIASKDFQIDIITRNNGSLKQETSRYLRVVKLGPKATPYNQLSKLLYLTLSAFYLMKNRYDLVHAHAFLPGLVAKTISTLQKIPSVYTVHGTFQNTELNNRIVMFLEKFIQTRVTYNCQITVSRDFFNLKNTNKKIIYIPNGVNIAEFNKVHVKKFTNITFLFVGRLHPQKNLINIIVAFSKVVKINRKVHLILAGEGPLKTQLQNLVEELGLEKNVVFKGELKGTELIRLYKSCHLFILVSIYEGQPLTLLEAWAAKLPVLVSNIGDCRFLVEENQNGFLVNNPLNVKEITSKILFLLKRKNLIRIGENGYKLVEKSYSWEKSAKETLQVYKKVLGK